jgi:hypothetical protein
MKRAAGGVNTAALFDEYRALVGTEMADFLQLYLSALEQDARIGVVRGEPERTARAEQDILEVVQDARERVELLKQRFEDREILNP